MPVLLKVFLFFFYFFEIKPFIYVGLLLLRSADSDVDGDGIVDKGDALSRRSVIDGDTESKLFFFVNSHSI